MTDYARISRLRNTRSTSARTWLALRAQVLRHMMAPGPDAPAPASRNVRRPGDGPGSRQLARGHAQEGPDFARYPQARALPWAGARRAVMLCVPITAGEVR
jgi:hypothetical protein